MNQNEIAFLGLTLAERIASKYAKPGTLKFQAACDAARDALIDCLEKRSDIRVFENYAARAMSRRVKQAVKDFRNPVPGAVEVIAPDRAGVTEIHADLAAVTSPRDKQIVELRLQGKTCDEIGEILGLNPGHVSRLLKNIRERYEAGEAVPQPEPTWENLYKEWEESTTKSQPTNADIFQFVNLVPYLVTTPAEVKNFVKQKYGFDIEVQPQILIVAPRFATLAAADRADRIRCGRKDGDLHIILTTLCVDQLIPAARYIITNNPPPVPKQSAAWRKRLEAML